MFSLLNYKIIMLDYFKPSFFGKITWWNISNNNFHVASHGEFPLKMIYLYNEINIIIKNLNESYTDFIEIWNAEKIWINVSF